MFIEGSYWTILQISYQIYKYTGSIKALNVQSDWHIVEEKQEETKTSHKLNI